MAIAKFQMPDGRIARYEVPDGTSPEDASRMILESGTPQREDKYVAPHNVVMGALSGAANIGSTLMRPVDALLNTLGVTEKTNVERRADLEQFFKQQADPESLAFKGGELGSEIAGTAGAGGVLARGAVAAGQAVPALARTAQVLAPALESGGLSMRGAPAVGRVGNVAARAAGGAASGGAMAGLVDPEEAATGAMIGGALPGAVKAAGMAGKGVRAALMPRVSPEVAKLAQRAEELGIRIPADRLTNSKPLNALTASMEYIPGSGRASTMQNMFDDMNRALSKTIGENTPNMTRAVADAQSKLGAEFDRVLKGTTVKATPKYHAMLDQNLKDAFTQLPPDMYSVIKKQVDTLKMPPVGADIDGQAMYAIKRGLDKISGQNSPISTYADDLKKTLMEALNDSLGAKEAAKFANTRKQYGRVIELRKLVPAGAEGHVSAARLANTRPRDKELREIADISAQFLKGRESPHGAAQRITLGTLGAGAAAGGIATGTLPMMAGLVAAGRAGDLVLNRKAMRKLITAQPGGRNRLQELLSNPVSRAALLASGR